MAEDNLWVRIKPRNEKKGLKIRRYLAFGMRFDESLGWYKVPKSIDLSDGRRVDVAEYLSNVRNDNDDQDSPLAFDVMSEKDARSIDAKERKAAELRATALDPRPVRPVDMTSAELNSSPTHAEERIPGVSNDEPHLSQPIRPRRGRPPKSKTAA